MQFKTLFTASLLSGIAAAAPKATCTSEPKAQATGDAPKAFGLVALRSASPIHFASFSASQSGFDLKLPKDKQGAKCDGKDEGTATFTIKDGELFLYSSGKEQQIAYTDRSGMGKSPHFLQIILRIDTNNVQAKVFFSTLPETPTLATPRQRAGRSTTPATSSSARTTLPLSPAITARTEPGASGSLPAFRSLVTLMPSALASTPALLRLRSPSAASTLSTLLKFRD